MPSTSTTKSGTRKRSDRKLSDVAKHLVLPSDIVSSAYPSVEAQCRKMGVVHDDWQRGLGRAILAKRANGLYAAGIGGVIISICRQAGKTFTIGTIIFALCILFPRMKVLWTAHHTATTDETFETLAALARRPRIAPYIRTVRLGNGKQRITFRNGSRIMFGARDQGFGRGIPGVSIIVFDEAQILKQSALNDMIPAANTVENPLVLYMGTPPDPRDPSEVFKTRRRKMLAIERQRAAGEAAHSDTLYIEVGADRGADPDDRAQWAKGNPSYPDRTSAESVMRLRAQLPDLAAFLREGLGIWDEDQAGTRLIPPAVWSTTGVKAPPASGVKSFGVTFSRDGDRFALAGALKHPGGVHLELIDAGPPAGRLDEVADWLSARWRDTAMFALSGRAGATALKQALRERGVPERMIHVLNTTEYFASGALLEASLYEGTSTHLATAGQAALDDSIGCSDKAIRSRDGAWGWTATTPDGDEVPAEAISVAYWGARHAKRKPGQKQTGLVMT